MEIFMDKDDFIVSKTDTKGRIIYGNEIFTKMSGYTEAELLHAPHSILRHKDMPKVVFKLLWDRIKQKEPINAYVKNLTKDGNFYWVFANVTASFDKNNNIIGYYSVRRKPSAKGVEIIEPIYRKLLDIEIQQDLSASQNALNETLNKAGVSYDEFVLNLQK